MFDKKLSSNKLSADGVRTVYTIRVVGGTQLKNERLLRGGILIGDMFDSQKILKKSPKTIGAENDQRSMLYNLDP